jgi:hypothetical protein
MNVTTSPTVYILAGALVVIIVATLWLLPASSPTQTASEPLTCPPLPENDALRIDAQYYANDFGVSIDEAVCRLSLQGEVGPLGAALRSREPDTYAGLWIHHEPDFGVTVLFTENPEATLAPYVIDHPLEGIIKARKAEASLRYLEQAQNQAHDLASATGIRVESGINVPENRVELYVIDVKSLTRALREAGSRLPDHVKIIKVDQHSSPA